MFINNLEQADWIKKRFETPGVLSMENDDKRTLMARLIRSTRYGFLFNYYMFYSVFCHM